MIQYSPRTLLVRMGKYPCYFLHSIPIYSYITDVPSENCHPSWYVSKLHWLALNHRSKGMKFPSTKNAGCIEVPTTPFFCLRRQTMIEAKVNDVQKSSDISQGPRLHRPFRVSGPMVSHNYVVCLTTTNEEVLRVLLPTLHRQWGLVP